LCPNKSHKIFNFRELAKVTQVEIFPNSLPFSVLSGVFRPPAASSLSGKRETSELFSVIQLSNITKTQKSGDFPASFENFRVTAPKTIFEFNNSLILSFGSGNVPLPLF